MLSSYLRKFGLESRLMLIMYWYMVYVYVDCMCTISVSNVCVCVIAGILRHGIWLLLEHYMHLCFLYHIAIHRLIIIGNVISLDWSVRIDLQAVYMYFPIYLRK